MDPIRIVIADDHPLYREGVARSLSDDPALSVVGEAHDAPSAVDMAERLQPDLVLLDLSMPGGGGIAALARIMAFTQPPKVAMLTASEEDDDVMLALKGGALGYILKGVGSRDLVGVVKDLAAGQSYVSPSLAARIKRVGDLGDGAGAHGVQDAGGQRRRHIGLPGGQILDHADQIA